jgi:cytochrome b6-f complex iron-sulfur subunit
MAAKVARVAGQAPALTATPVVEKKVAAPAPAVVKTAPPSPTPKTAIPATEAIDSHITRRELLNYAWLASLALFAVETVGLSLWFAFPNFKTGQFGGQFAIGAAVEVLPEVNAAPTPYTDGKFWLVNLDTTNRHDESRKGILALYKVCTHLGCLYEWVPVTHRFECPCHGSKFELTGDYISGPARRSLDRFVIQAVALDGSIKETDAEGRPLVVNGDETLIIDTGKRILGASIA